MVINVPTRTKREKKSPNDWIILNPELWGFKTQVFKPTLSDHFGQTLHLDHSSLQQKNLKTKQKAVYKNITVTNEPNTDQLNYLLVGDDWENV